MTPRARDGMAVLAVAVACAALAAGVLGLGAELAYIGPAAALALALVLGIYPGAEALSRALAQRRPRRRPSSTPPRPARPRGTVPRGGALVGSSLAGRAPPPAPDLERTDSKRRSGYPMRHITKLAGLAALAAFPATAGAHVTLQPDSAAGGGFTREDVRVPNERDDASTTKVVIQLPPGFVFASTEPVPGWKVTIDKAKLAKPVKTDDGEVTEEVRQITWTGDGKTGKIGPGQFQDFGLSVQIPEKKAGTELTFKALQTYSDGDVVRWIGPPDAEEPAPQVKVTAAGAEEHAAPGAATAAPEAEDDGGPSTGLVIVALALGAAGLVAGAAGLATARRKAG